MRGLRRLLLLLPEKEHRLERNVGGLRRPAGAAGDHATERAVQSQLDLVEAEHRGRTVRNAFGRERGGETVALDFIMAAIIEKAITPGNPALGEMHGGRALAMEGAKPRGVSAVS